MNTQEETIRVLMYDDQPEGPCMIVKVSYSDYSMDFSIEQDILGDSIGYSYEGHVKWDGCINWRTNPDLYAHSCGLDDIEHFCKAMTVVFDAASRIPNWS